MTSHPQATFYVQLEPEYGWGIAGREAPIVGAKAVGITQKKPTKPKPGSVIVKLTVALPEAAFRPLQPEAVINIPDNLTQAAPVEVTAEDPN